MKVVFLNMYTRTTYMHIQGYIIRKEKFVTSRACGLVIGVFFPVCSYSNCLPLVDCNIRIDHDRQISKDGVRKIFFGECTL